MSNAHIFRRPSRLEWPTANIEQVGLVMAAGSFRGPDAQLDRKSSLSDEPDTLLTPRPQWQSAANLPQRRLMVQRVMAMTKHNGRLNISEEEWEARAPAIARRVELSLYSRAASLAEYEDTTTLRRRLQSLVALSYHEAAAIAKAPTPAARRLVPRLKRKHEYEVEDAAKALRAERSEVTSATFIISNEDVMRHVYSFLDGADVLRHMAVNRYASKFLPSCVYSFKIDCKVMHKAFKKSPFFLARYPSLRTLHIYNDAVPESKTNDSTLHAWACKELDIAHNNIGERTVVMLSKAIAKGCCKKLEKLCLLSLFTNTTHINGIKVLCKGLRKGHCAKLKEVFLGGNSISDSGVEDIASWLSLNHCKNLERLDIRRNYVGEAGVAALMKVLGRSVCPRLKFLCAGGNIITDKSVETITSMLSGGACPQMRFLGLEDNFITSQGVKNIVDAAVTGGMMPKLHKVCHRDSSVCNCNPPERC